MKFFSWNLILIYFLNYSYHFQPFSYHKKWAYLTLLGAGFLRYCKGRGGVWPDPPLVSQLWDPKNSKTQFSQTKMVLGFHLSSDQPPELHSIFRSSLEVAETQECDRFGTNFQHRQFLTYRHVMHLKKFLKAY